MKKVIIGIPVFNGAEYIEETLESLKKQSFKDFTVLISDNCSTDNTAKICKQYSLNDHRFIYKCHDTNLGPLANFKYILDQIDSQYFMFLGHDDSLSLNFLEICVKYMDENVDISISSGQTLYYDQKIFLSKGVIHNHLQKHSGLRLMDYYFKVKDNGIFYGLMRMQMVDKKMFTGEFASDHHWVARLILKGKSKILIRCKVNRQIGEASSKYASNFSSKLIINQANTYLKIVFINFKKMYVENTIGVNSFIGVLIIVVIRWYVKRFIGIKQFQLKNWLKKSFL
jgi:glycosyltransferase involved in cell wall biosynthesis